MTTREVATNQFTAKIRFDPVAWRAYDPDTRSSSLVIDNGGRSVSWSVKFRDGQAKNGTATTPSGARAACRRAIAGYAGARKRK